MTERLTSSRRAGTSRKLVAVGTESDFSMFSTMRAPTPRIGSPGTAGGAAGGSTAAGAAGVAGAAAAAGVGGAAGAAPLAGGTSLVVTPLGPGPGGR